MNVLESYKVFFGGYGGSYLPHTYNLEYAKKGHRISRSSLTMNFLSRQ